MEKMALFLTLITSQLKNLNLELQYFSFVFSESLLSLAVLVVDNSGWIFGLALKLLNETIAMINAITNIPMMDPYTAYVP